MRLALYLVLCFFSVSSFAGSGKAIVPSWIAGGNNSITVLTISNITDNDIAVNVVFYGKDGQVIQPSQFENFTLGNSVITAGNTGQVRISSTTSQYGYAVINWENTADDAADDTIALVARGYHQVVDTARRTNSLIQINNGMPF
ncbi:hypothetical protein ACO1HB_17490 [Alteromonas macleodii]|uniref:hypothetical protein n=1 Tax=Alteromonas macleodii TaxID=28108 RepID=UPI003BF8B17F